MVPARSRRAENSPFRRGNPSGFRLHGMDLEINDTLPVEFSCNCSKDRVRKALISIGREELQSMIDDGETIEVNCHFCNKNYNFTVDELKQMIQ